MERPAGFIGIRMVDQKLDEMPAGGGQCTLHNVLQNYHGLRAIEIRGERHGA